MRTSIGEVLHIARISISNAQARNSFILRSGYTYAVEASQVLGSIKDNGGLVTNIEKLLQVEDLNVVVIRLAANNYVVLEHPNLSPDSGLGARGLRQTSKVPELAA